jgi:hypothetical protein
MVGIAIGWTGEDGGRCLGSVVLEPGEALSYANAPLAAVGTALANDEKSQDRAVAEILRDVDMDAALAELLNGQ